MKKSFAAAFCLCAAIGSVCAVFAGAGCSKKTDYTDYISEKRSDIFVHEDDTVNVTVYCTEKEQPYAADGIKSEMNSMAEIFVSLPKNPQELCVSVEGFEGEMNYQSVENRYYLSFSAPAFEKKSLEITLTADGESNVYTALTVKYAGVMSCEDAVLCAVEHDGALFENLTVNGIFDGEIYVRLLYDEGCYYYVGVCDKQKHITAYLIDGEHGKVIATKQLDG